jgi:acetylglutamate kinase
MRVLLKLGGTSWMTRLRAREIAEVSRRTELQLVLVHGGGKVMSQARCSGCRIAFVGGLRVTTPEVLDAVLKVFAGTVNHQLVASLVAAGVPAVGITGIDACLTEADQLHPDLGAVGRPIRTDPRLLDVLVQGNFLPVVACVAGDRMVVL